MNLNKEAKHIVEVLKNAGHIAYFAGGCVRDRVMGRASSDIDIATNALPQEIVKLFPKTIPVGIAFGVVIVVIKGHQFEVSSFRKDYNYIDGRRPERIEFSTPEEDAQRRDFTINGMFFDPVTEDIHDYVGGQEDIKNRVVRTIGNPLERFFEDRLRIIRAVRFAVRFDFTIDEHTQKAIKDFAPTLFPSVSIERVWQELKKMAEGPRFESALLMMYHLGLLKVIFPTLSYLDENTLKIILERFSHFPKNCPPILYIIELFPQASLNELLAICTYLKVSNYDAKLVEFVFNSREMIRKNSDLRSWVYFYADPRMELSLGVITASYSHEMRLKSFVNHHALRQQLSKHIERVINKTPLITAQILKDQGILPGKAMGELLREAEVIAINQNLHDPEAVLQQLKQSPSW